MSPLEVILQERSLLRGTPHASGDGSTLRYTSREAVMLMMYGTTPAPSTVTRDVL